MASDAVTLIMSDHRVMEQLFDRLRAGSGDRQLLLDEIAARLTAHSHAEEQRVYPELPAELAHHGADEHHEAERMLHDLQRMGPDDEAFADRLDDFIAAVGHHVQEEESTVLPALRDAVGDARLIELGAAFEQVRLEELAVAGISVS
ncbi:hemerythrin domain-containing protein [Dactylosporangium aurantiacum]|uniref:Hemerythrin domain-containing protein n=1 Tax=Dactylosporangium aurantiacum TaxID=35754 RepID=A0A9Q9INF0_9ACTN|nr:hemerythrin domain-containing protein [Dactylosporangium aurantiacum]MDG6108987.1 hemerythrin domain-containing protein [Dactylosporangium aurantiacum]UWZ56509.1 hemerythrin domain-containing protein [Dactylosporangium aurantiacum]